MNQTFSPSRFGRLLRTYFTENRTSLLASIAVLVVLLTVVALLAYHQYPGAASRNRYLMLFFIGGAAWYLFTVQQVAVLNEKERAITYLLRPASQLEKWILLLLVSGLGFLLVCLSLFTLIDAVGVWYVNHRDWDPQHLNDLRQFYNGNLLIRPYYDPETLAQLPIVLWVGAVLVHPITLAFALLIRRYAMPLIPVLAFIAFLVVMLANERILGSMIGAARSMTADPFSDIKVVQLENNWRLIRVPQPIGDMIRYGTGAVVVLLLYVTAFFRLKEREV